MNDIAQDLESFKLDETMSIERYCTENKSLVEKNYGYHFKVNIETGALDALDVKNFFRLLESDTTDKELETNRIAECVSRRVAMG